MSKTDGGIYNIVFFSTNDQINIKRVSDDNDETNISISIVTLEMVCLTTIVIDCFTVFIKVILDITSLYKLIPIYFALYRNIITKYRIIVLKVITMGVNLKALI